jgi:REP element-mobilizing transposase RayT
MPRKARLDAYSTLHHVMARGIERSSIFRGDKDRTDFLEHLGSLAEETKTTIYAWALIPNHFHILLRSGKEGLSYFMRRLLTGYAVRFNRKYKRSGHLFQNRYTSIVCEEEPYFMELIRYIHGPGIQLLWVKKDSSGRTQIMSCNGLGTQGNPTGPSFRKVSRPPYLTLKEEDS